MNTGHRYGSGFLLHQTWLNHTNHHGIHLRELAVVLEAGC